MLNKVLCICLTDTKVPILTKKTLLAVRGRLSRRACAVQECVWDACKALACCWGGALVSGTGARPGINACVCVCWYVCIPTYTYDLPVCVCWYVYLPTYICSICIYVCINVYISMDIYSYIYIGLSLYMRLPACSRCGAPYLYAPYAENSDNSTETCCARITTCWHDLPFNTCSACWKQWQQRLRRASADCRPKK